MKIASIMIAYNEVDCVKDTIESLQKYATNKILLVVDEAGWHNFTNFSMPNVIVKKGLYHHVNRGPYKNMALGLHSLYELFPNCDWYWYIEPDVLLANASFKLDLDPYSDLIGVDYRESNGCNLELLAEILNVKNPRKDCTMLGCCQIFSKRIMDKFHDIKFFENLLERTKQFKGEYFPGHTYYAAEETIFPTAVKWLGYKIKCLATGSNLQPFHSDDKGQNKKYVIEFGKNIDIKEIYPSTSIIHPLKRVNDPIRQHYKNIRNRCKI